jgi:energy-coupling factor transporter ATP-binding protein EcfA2
MDTGLTTLSEKDILKHLTTAQSLVERATVVVKTDRSPSKTELAGTRRRFVSTISTGPSQSSLNVKIKDTIQAVVPEDSMLSIAQHTLLHRLRRALAVALAMNDVFARQTDLESLIAENKSAPLSGDKASQFHNLLAAGSFVTAFTAAAFIVQTIDISDDPSIDLPEPVFSFETPHEALKHFLYGIDLSIKDSPDDQQMLARAKGFARAMLEGLLARRARFEVLSSFEQTHIRLDADDFELNGFDIRDRGKRKKLVMNFKKPNELIGNHIAKYQAIKLTKMMMAYDFDRQLNPFVELGGFLFTFIGDGNPGTGKTTLIQMIAGLIKDYCDVANYPFHYENFGVDQISSYQGKSGQNCKQFIDNVLDPRVIGFGTVDDIDQIAAKRSDDRASAGQQEITAVLMEGFSGSGTVIRGNCSFGMFSNYPENVDDALRQRAGARWLVDGPQTTDDYIDIFALLIGKNHDIPLGDYELYASQEIKQAISAAYEKHAKPQEEALLKVFDKFGKAHGELKNLKDIGLYLHAIKQAEPRFTGRAIKNITDAVKMRAMDIELPDEWFENPEQFMHKSFDEKRDMIAELRSPITMEMIVQEVNRYADSEFRYTDKSDAAAVDNIIRDQRVRERALEAITEMKEQGQWNG